MSNQTPEIIRYFVSKVPGAGRTQIVKFLYLADLEARRHLGRPITTLNYIWYDHGPFDSEILRLLDQLCDAGLINAERLCYPGGKSGYRYSSTKEQDSLSVGFSKEDSAILDFVVNAYGKTPLKGLLEDVVYQTIPMQDAKEREAHEGRLRMELVDNEARVPGLELERVLQAVENLDCGQGRPLHEVIAAARK